MYQRGCKLLVLGAVASLYSVTAFGTTYNLKENPHCSLVEAVEAVTWQKAVGACEAGTGNDRILLEQNKTYSLDAQLVVGGGTRTVKEKVEGEEGEEPEEIDVIKPINNITLRIEVASEPGQRDEDKELATIKAADNDRVLWVRSATTVILEHIRLEGGNVTSKPLEVEWREHPAFDASGGEVTFSLARFSEAPFGGAVFVEGTLTTRIQVEIEEGIARKGGAIYVNGSSVGLEQIKLLNMEAVSVGEPEVVHCLEESQLVEEPSFCAERSLSAPPEKWADYKEEYEEIASGGAIHLQKGRLNLTQAWFEGNQAEYGGAIAIDPLYDGTLEVSGAYFAHNIASQNGGAIRFAKSERSPRVTVVNTLMHDNHAAMGGGALHFSPLGKSSDLIFNNITVFQNTVEGEGAGIWFEEPISNGAFLNSVVLANESGAYKRANKSDFKDALITGVWQVNGSGPEYRYEFTQIDEDGLKQYELDQPLFDDNDEPWLRLENSLDYVGRKGNEWRTLEELLAEPSDVAAKWFDAWSDALPNIGSALKISAAKDEQSFTVSKGGKTLFVLEQKEAQLPAEIIPGDGVDFSQVQVFSINEENAIPVEYDVSLEPVTLGELKAKYLLSEDTLDWKEGGIKLADNESYNLDENGRIFKDDIPQYLGPNRELISDSGSEPTVNNINEISYINAFLENSHPDIPRRSYLWHGNTEHEGISELTIEQQRALLRGKPTDKTTNSKTQTCKKDCEPIKWEGLPYFTVNFEEVDQFSLLASGAPYVLDPQLGGANVCEPKDMRGLTRQDRCDAGAVDFQRALGKTDTYYITVGGQGEIDVLANDLGDSDVDCFNGRVLGLVKGQEDTYEKCLEIVNPSTRLGVIISVVMDDKGYPKVKYNSGKGFHGHDYFEYRVTKDAFPPNTTLGANDVGARVAVVSEPGSGIKSDSLGSAHFAWLLGLLGLGALRRLKTKRYWALSLAILLSSSMVNAAEVIVSDKGLIEESAQYPVDVCTLRAAIASTEAPPTNTACSQGSGGASRDIILLPEGEVVLWDTLKINQNNSLEIRGKGPDKTIIKMRKDEGVCARLFETESALTLSNMTLEGGCTEPDAELRGGAALYVYGHTPPSVGMKNVVVKNNRAMGANGGAVFLAYRGDNRAEASFDSVYFENNSAKRGGAIYIDAIDPSSRNNIHILNSAFTGHDNNDNESTVFIASGNNVRLNIVNSLFFKNENIAVDLANHTGSTYILNDTFLENKLAFKFAGKATRFAIHNSIVADAISGKLADTKNQSASFNLLAQHLMCDSAAVNDDSFCVRDKDNNEFIDRNDIISLHENDLTKMSDCDEGDEGCEKQNRWFVPYLVVQEAHDTGGSQGLCEVIVEDEEGNEVSESINCILERGNPASLQTGAASPTSCRTTDMRGKTRAAGGQCDRGAYETQINTALPDIGNNANRRSRTALMNVLRNDIPGDDMWIRTGTLEIIPLEGFPVPSDAEELKEKIDEYEHTQNLRKHFGDKNEKLESFLAKGGKTLAGELIVVKAEIPGVELGLGEDPVPQYYDDIIITNADGREDKQSSDRALESMYQCGEDEDEDCLVFYEAPHTYLCSDLPFEDYFSYSVEAWKYDSTKPLDEDELPEFKEDQAAETFTGYVQVTIANIPPIVPREGIKHRINPGDKIVFALEGVRPIEGGVDVDRPIKIEKLTLEKEPQFALRNGRTHEVLGTGLFLNSEEMSVTYVHSDASKTFPDTFSVKVTDSCGASSIVPIRIEFHGEKQEGGGASWMITFLLTVVGFARRKLLIKAV